MILSYSLYTEVAMAERRIHVWVQRFSDRPHLVLQWFDPDTGKRKSKSAETADPEKAEDVREKLQYELRQGKYQEPSTLTWKAVRERYEAEQLPGCRPRTRELMRTVLDHFESICNPRKLQGINERMISLFASGLRQRKGRSTAHMAPYTVKVYLAFLHGVLSWAVEQKVLHECPKFPSIKVTKKKPQPVPAESFESLLAKAPDQQMRAFLLCGWLAGLRLNEAFELERESTDHAPWVDFDRKRIWLPGAFTKGTEDAWLPLDGALAEALLLLPRQPGRKVFRFQAKDGRLIGFRAVSQRVCALARRAGVRLTMKSLRKGFGCYYANRVSAHVLQKLMRHANIRTTLEYYANFDPAVEEAVFARTSDPRLCNANCNDPGLHNGEETIPGDAKDCGETH
jgi:integrase